MTPTRALLLLFIALCVANKYTSSSHVSDVAACPCVHGGGENAVCGGGKRVCCGPGSHCCHEKDGVCCGIRGTCCQGIACSRHTPRRCDVGWTALDDDTGKCYWFTGNTRKTTWHNAQAYCETLNATLIRPTHSVTNEWVRHFSIPICSSEKCCTGKLCCAGTCDDGGVAAQRLPDCAHCRSLNAELIRVNNQETHDWLRRLVTTLWLGLNDRERPVYTNWRAGSPRPGRTETCVRMDNYDGKWTFSECATAYPFACWMTPR